MKKIIARYFAITDHRLVEALCADIKEIMSESGLTFEDVIELIESNADAEHRGIFDMWFDGGDNIDNTACTIGKILCEIGWHYGKDGRTVDEVLWDAHIIDF